MLKILGCRQAVRHQTLTLTFPGFESLHPSQKKNEAIASFFFYPIRRIGMASTRPARCMELRRSRVWHRAKRVLNLVLLRIDAIHHFVMIPFAPSSRFHTATSCGFHTRLRRDLTLRRYRVKSSPATFALRNQVRILAAGVFFMIMLTFPFIVV